MDHHLASDLHQLDTILAQVRGLALDYLHTIDTRPPASGYVPLAPLPLPQRLRSSRQEGELYFVAPGVRSRPRLLVAARRVDGGSNPRRVQRFLWRSSLVEECLRR